MHCSVNCNTNLSRAIFKPREVRELKVAKKGLLVHVPLTQNFYSALFDLQLSDRYVSYWSFIVCLKQVFLVSVSLRPPLPLTISPNSDWLPFDLLLNRTQCLLAPPPYSDIARAD